MEFETPLESIFLRLDQSKLVPIPRTTPLATRSQVLLRDPLIAMGFALLPPQLDLAGCCVMAAIRYCLAIA